MKIYFQLLLVVVFLFLSIVIKALTPITSNPLTPGNIIGPTLLCPNATVTYSITPVPNASGYIWTSSGNLQTLSGQGSNSIVVKTLANFNGGSLKVKSVNCKGNSGQRHLNITKDVNCKLSKNVNVSEFNLSSEKFSELKVFPNPTTGKITFTFYSDSKSKIKLNLIDLPGKSILNKMIDAIAGENMNVLDLSNVSKGIYFLVIEREEIKLQAIKIEVE